MNDAKFKDGWLDGQMREACKDSDVREVVRLMCLELERAEGLHPDYPDDLVYRASIIFEEAGKLSKAVNDLMFAIPEGEFYLNHECEMRKKVRQEAIQVGAMAMRFLINFKEEAE